MKKIAICIVLLFGLISIISSCGGGSGEGGETSAGSNDDEDVNPSQDVVKSIYVNTTGSDKLVMTAVDANDRYYSFYGVKTEENLLVYVDKLVVDQLNQNDELEHFLTIDFDAHQRPIAYTLPDSKGKLVLDYISDLYVTITFYSDEGESVPIIEENPLPIPVQSTSHLPIYTSSMVHSNALDDVWEYQGDIKTCRDGSVPKITIERELSAQTKKLFPELRLVFSQKANKMNNMPAGDPDYNYRFNIIIINDLFTSWEEKCKEACTEVGFRLLGKGAVGVAIDYAFGIGKAIIWTVAVVYKSKEHADTKAKVAIDEVKGRMELGIPIATFVKNMAASLGSGPTANTCSKEQHKIYTEIVKSKLKISCSYKRTKKQITYKPLSPSVVENKKLDFDFTQKCQLNEVEGISAVATIPGYIGINFNAEKVDGSLGQLIDGEELLLDDIPTLSGEGYEGRDTLTIALSPYLSGPGIYDNLGYIVDLWYEQADGSIVFTTDNITDEGTVDELPVAFSATSGTVTVETFGNQVGNRIKGTFDVTITGYKEICDDPPACEASYFEPILGTLEGEFNGIIETSFHPVSVTSHQ